MEIWQDKLLSGVQCEKPVLCVAPAKDLSSGCVDVSKLGDLNGDERL